MTLLQTPRDRASVLIFVLGVLIVIALAPFLSGLLGAAVLYVIFVRLYKRLERTMRPGLAAIVTLTSALVVVALPLAWLISVLIAQAPEAMRTFQSSTVFARLADLQIGDFHVGAEVAKASGTIATWLSARVFAFVGSATSAVLNLVIAFFGFYYMLRSDGSSWETIRGYIPFSAETADALRDRFFSVTEATLLGTVSIGLLQGGLIGTGFWIVGLPSPFFWGTVAAIASILPVLGTSLVWLPATLILAVQNRYGAAITMLIIGAGVASNIDNLIRPLIYRRVSHIHPMITLVGAFAGVKYFGLLGVLLGPLAIAYLFALLHFYRQEYGDASGK
jgi:predicted PurR-regulated permease PerM